MRLSVLAERVPGEATVLGPDVAVGDVTHDSRLVEPGDLFVAVRGLETDGHRYLAAALEAGAAAVAVEEALAVPRDDELSQLVVDDTRSALGPLAAAVHGEPSQRIAVVGVTGTNGKTTVTHLLESIVSAAGMTPGVIGTVGAHLGVARVPLARTTPEASDLQRLLAEMVEAGVEVAALEVSSHALALQRVNGTWFRVVAFTNLMQDHLDFHGDMDSYLAAKQRLFDVDRAERAVVAIDDEAGRSIVAAVRIPVTTVAVDGEADISASHIGVTMKGSTFTVRTPEGEFAATIPLPGAFNVQNAIVAAAIARDLGIGEEAIIAGLADVSTIPGRFEPVNAGQAFGVVVDYAHTPDAIAAVLESAGSLAGGSVIALIGAGGDRDKSKRPAMGSAAAAADLVVVTSDNPRSEDPEAIIGEVAAGVPPGIDLITEPDRRAAIRAALRAAGDHDLVLILGKGHEQGQEVAGIVHPFDDRVVVVEELGALAEAEA
jgi:UDP-N-acetylmuramoyl-L-alanyl-D-glutamate--2,6-diaminopimelate ligase